MALTAGSRLGPYEILAPIGAGGMGEVYKARDTRLERTVAVKVLPQHLSSSPETRQRFEREAKTISQLSHSHICALYDVGRDGETEYLVMEFLEGETLAERLAKGGALPLEQTLRYGTQIAEALEKAHRQGVVHRDLKPGNVMLTASGVKLLDFGLAKAMAAPGKASGVTSFPTVAGGPSLTQEGTILGTFQYMAPEQLEGKEADSRTDVFALGAVLYEMATGRKAFSGTSQASLISSIMKEDPAPVSTISPMSPPALDRVIRTCLAKDPEDRWQSARDAASALRWAAEDGSKAGVPAPVARGRRRREAIAWTVAGIAIAAVVALGLRGGLRRGSVPAVPRSFVMLPPSPLEADAFAVSPDGAQVVFSLADKTGQSSLWIRTQGSVEPRPLPGTEGGIDPFWSHDGKHIAFFTGNALQRMAIEGGPPQRLAPADRYGGAWNREGTMLYTETFGKPLLRISASGGTPEQETVLDAKNKELAHFYPQFLPDGRRYLFMVRNVDPAKSGVWLGKLGSKERRLILLAGGGPIYCDPGFLLFSRAGALFAQKFDAASGELSGEPVMIAEKVAIDVGSSRLMASAAAGLLVYRARGEANRTLTWFDRDGRAGATVGPSGLYRGLALSPDGKRVAYALVEPKLGTTDIWVRDLVRGTALRLTSDPTDEFNPAWTPDGESLYYTSDREGLYHIYRRPASSSGAEETVLKDDVDKWMSHVAPDGSALLFTSFGKDLSFDVWMHPLAPGGKPEPFRHGPFRQGMARFSPDSRWIVYTAGGSGRAEVFVAGRSPHSKTIQVSTDGGYNPLWSSDGRELYYLSLDGKFMAASLREAGGALEPGAPRMLFATPFASEVGDERTKYAVAPDGRFLVTVEPEKRSADPVVAILDWTAAFRK